ncbi:MAG: tRNA uridine-5-carboxymethylaminomethyl(34) synthesis enzyme MnmG, partial [Christensenellaceae bacterium]
GVLIDDLVTKGASEPYRMMTSRAEYRLLLRQDNADLRLTGMGRRVGLVSDARYDRMMRKRDETERLVRHLKQTVLPPGEGLNGFLASKDYPPAVTGLTMAELLRRPPVRLAELDRLDPAPLEVGGDAREQAEIQVKYEGYIQRQQQEVERFRRLEQMTLDADLDYSQIAGLRLEARQKLAALRPASVGQAARILGVSPADIGVLLVYVKSKGRRTQ